MAKAPVPTLMSFGASRPRSRSLPYAGLHSAVSLSAAIRKLHDAPLPRWRGRGVEELASR